MFLPAFVKLSCFATGFACFLAGVAIICASSASPEPLVLNNPSAQPCVMGLGRTLLVFCQMFMVFHTFCILSSGITGICVCVGVFCYIFYLPVLLFALFISLALLSFARVRRISQFLSDFLLP